MTRLDRVRQERERLAELLSIRWELSEDEINEVLELSRKERQRANQRAWRNRNVERERERIRAWQIANPERMRVYSKQYRDRQVKF